MKDQWGQTRVRLGQTRLIVIERTSDHRKRGRNYFLIILAFTHNVDYTAQRTVCCLTANNPYIMLLARLTVDVVGLIDDL